MVLRTNCYATFPYWKLILFKQLLHKNCEVDFVEICNVCTRKVIIKTAKRIFYSDKICRSYCDFYLGVTFLEHTVYGFCHPSASLEQQNTITSCVDDVGKWMHSKRLQWNTAMTEILWSTTGRHSHQLPQSPLRVGTDIIPTAIIRDLGIYIDSNVSMRSHVTKTVSVCFTVLHQLQSVHRFVPRSVLQSLVMSLILMWLDYGNTPCQHSAVTSQVTSVCDELCCSESVRKKETKMFFVISSTELGRF